MTNPSPMLQTPMEAIEKASETFSTAAKELDALKLDTSVPESVRALAEKTVNQTREAYERSKDAMGGSIEAMERSFDAAGQGATAFNRKLIDIAQRNLNSGFDRAKSLARRQESCRDCGAAVGVHPQSVRRAFEPSRRDPGAHDQDCRGHLRAHQGSGVSFLRRGPQGFLKSRSSGMRTSKRKE